MLAQKKIDRRPGAVFSDEAVFHPHSFADDAGRLFWKNGQLCRGIYPNKAPFFARLFREGVIENLAKRGLIVETELTNQIADGFSMVMRHRRAPFVSYPQEWSAAMLKDAALAILDLAIELAERNLALKDAHPWNVLFDACKPVYVDVTSIEPQKDESSWPAYDEFCRFCYYPLILMSHGQERIARALLPEYEGVLRSNLLTVMRGSGPSRFILSRLIRRGSKAIKSVFSKQPGARQSALSFLKQARRDVESIQLPSYKKTLRERGDDPMLSLSSQSQWTPRQRALAEAIDDLKPGSALDISRGATWTSTLPASLGSDVVSIDADPARVDALYETARKNNLPLLPLIVDFVKPTPSVGYSSHYSIAATERLKCDMVIALGLASKVATQNHFDSDLIVEGLSSFSKRWLVVEFDGGASSSSSLDDFTKSLRKRFSGVRALDSNEDAGALLLCEK